MTDINEAERAIHEADLEACRRMIDPQRGAWRPPDFTTTPATIQAVTGWLQAPAIAPG